ncbi:MAG TPA: PHP domain-containing protein [Patescibacteria group bacterium]|nr:PHP domain-containing protein [Patescibacteria group bacterium]
MSRVDLHIHTNKSDGSGSVTQVLSAAAAKPELLAIAITDHNEISGALEAARKAPKYGVNIIVGEEISTLAGHILGIFLTEKIERGLTPTETIRSIHSQGGLAVIPHVFPHYRGIGTAILEQLLSDPDPLVHPDAVEVRNGFPPQLVFYSQIRSQNLKKWHLSEVGGSDSHHPSSVGACWTEFDGSNLAGFRQAIEKGLTRAGGNGWGVLETARATVRDATKHIRRRFHD